MENDAVFTNKKVLVLSGIGLFRGGTLSIMSDCMQFLNDSKFASEYRIVACVYQKALFENLHLPNIALVEFPKTRASYLHRLYYEYFYFHKLARVLTPVLWLSMHDVTPRLNGIRQAVYRHNPTPFGRLSWSDLKYQPALFFFSLFYKFLYRLNLHANRYVIVQQNWMKEKFVSMFGVDPQKIITAPPQMLPAAAVAAAGSLPKRNKKLFFYPAIPLPYKNLEVICEAVLILHQKKPGRFEAVLTLNGTESSYAKMIVEKYRYLPEITFTGQLTRAEVEKYYEKTDALIFPSRLETWGMPISEFKKFGRPVLLADLPYARETAGEYPQTKFFAAGDAAKLAGLMLQLIEDEKNISFDPTFATINPAPHAANWAELFEILLA